MEELSIPEVAAALRAQQRRELDGVRMHSIHDEVAAAEAAYVEPDELWTEDGIPIEPFHLKREREEGYFDADGVMQAAPSAAVPVCKVWCLVSRTDSLCALLNCTTWYQHHPAHRRFVYL